MTIEEVRKHYPGAAKLVYLCETNEIIQAMMVLDREENISPERFVRDQVADMRRRFDEGWMEAVEVIVQLESPCFLKYIRAKLGAM